MLIIILNATRKPSNQAVTMTNSGIFSENALQFRGLEPDPRMESVEHAKSVVERDHRSQINGLDEAIRGETCNVALRYRLMAHGAHQFPAHVNRRSLPLRPVAKRLPQPAVQLGLAIGDFM